MNVIFPQQPATESDVFDEATGRRRYEPVDAKLARTARPTALLQAAAYADALIALGHPAPQRVHLWLGGGAGAPAGVGAAAPPPSAPSSVSMRSGAGTGGAGGGAGGALACSSRVWEICEIVW